ncbi:hypothetical protein LCGC14_2148980 [marine sediment metagenome]|uniref:Uncharacterized protein n=1 Tax=marine sediment metagenome TaxID=412755 RepID=A0A0F9GSC7_9ZZZZ|nr:hypothetical protein [Pricia sp.]
MKKLFIIAMIVLSLSLVTGSRAADVELKITVPDAWVDVTIAAINSKWPKPNGIGQKQWAETQIRIWLRNIVGAYKRTLDRSTALDAGGYVDTKDDDIPIEISP